MAKIEALPSGLAIAWLPDLPPGGTDNPPGEAVLARTAESLGVGLCTLEFSDEGVLVQEINEMGLRLLARTRETSGYIWPLRKAVAQADWQHLESTLSDLRMEGQRAPLYFRSREVDGAEGHLLAGSVGLLAHHRDRRTLQMILMELPRPDGQDSPSPLAAEERLHHQKMESLGLLAGGIAHDFNNYLMAILGNAGLALLEVPDGSPAARFIKQVETAASRASDLTKELMVYAGRRKPSLLPVNLSDLVLEMSGLMRSVISKRALFQYQLANDLPLIEGDSSQLRQVIMNLLTNASDALGENGGVISLRTQTVRFRPHADADLFLGENLRRSELYVAFEITDTGNGMDEETRRRLFDPFFTTKRKGRGLGLAAVLGILLGHGAAVELESFPEKGTTFRLFFPPSADQRHCTRSKADTQPLRNSGLRGTVLVADDDDGVVGIASTILNRAGFHTLVARNGREAVELFKQYQQEIVAILLDIIMPELHGDEAYAEIAKINSNVPTLFTSGYHDNRALSRLCEGRRADFIEKPYTPSQLEKKMLRLVEGAPESE